MGCLVLTGIAVPVLRSLQSMDIPNNRSSHTVPVPRGGGVAVVPTICVVALAVTQGPGELWALLGAALGLATVGLVDDLRQLSSLLRLLIQVFAGLILVVVLLLLGVSSWWSMPVLVVAVVGYVNAFNFMDGINGISALSAAVVGVWWAWVGFSQNHELLHVLGLVLAGAALGFLPWNSPKSKVFLGDVGSYGIGMFIVGLSVLAFTAGLPWHWSVAPLAVYGADTGWVLVKRFFTGESLGEAHRGHVYQRLVDGGWSHLGSAATCATAAAAVCASAAVGGTDLHWWLPVTVLLITLCYLTLPTLMGDQTTNGTAARSGDRSG